MDEHTAGVIADKLIGDEVAVQDRMWGLPNERADSTKNQLLSAAVAQLLIAKLLVDGATEDEAIAAAKEFYPPDWDGLRSYGSISANLAVAGAFIRSEIKRRVASGEDFTRTKRGEPYVTAHPYVSSDQAIAEITDEAARSGTNYTGL